MQKTQYCSWRNKELAKGCQLCVHGKKLVLFVTGLCPRNCFYCPLSEKKKNKDNIWANEWLISDDKDIIKEAELCESKGAGITGGDPLMRLERTVKYIKMLKKRFGKEFHIHLYAPLENVDEEKLKKLYDAGLDEIRFHPELLNKANWYRLLYARKFGWLKGIEIPIIPHKSFRQATIDLIEYAKHNVDFFNFNELEFSDLNADKVAKLGLTVKNKLSYAAKGSQEFAFELMKKYPELRIHYCTATLKDKVQLGNRLKRRAKNAKTEFDAVTKEGMLVRGAVYVDEIKPGFGYRKKLSNLTKKQQANIINKLNKLKKQLEKKYGKNFIIDGFKLRILTSQKVAKKAAKQYPNCAIAKEYPTHDATEIELEFLS
ncbi:radical SAM protein [Candidatus Woesearchaeota archaeon]|nr:radical SAM protein [Candidatus Woesearchaeota archaeon]